MNHILLLISLFVSWNISAQETLLDKSLKNLDSTNKKLTTLADKAKKQIDVSKTEIDAEKDKKVVNPNYIQNAEVSNVAEGDFYTVELYFDRFPLDRSHNIYKAFPDLQESIVLGTFRYTIGRFNTEKLATKFTENIKKKGFMGTVVKFEKGKRVMN